MIFENPFKEVVTLGNCDVSKLKRIKPISNGEKMMAERARQKLLSMISRINSDDGDVVAEDNFLDKSHVKNALVLLGDLLKESESNSNFRCTQSEYIEISQAKEVFNIISKGINPYTEKRIDEGFLTDLSLIYHAKNIYVFFYKYLRNIEKVSYE